MSDAQDDFCGGGFDAVGAEGFLSVFGGSTVITGGRIRVDVALVDTVVVAAYADPRGKARDPRATARDRKKDMAKEARVRFFPVEC